MHIIYKVVYFCRKITKKYKGYKRYTIPTKGVKSIKKTIKSILLHKNTWMITTLKFWHVPPFHNIDIMIMSPLQWHYNSVIIAMTSQWCHHSNDVIVMTSIWCILCASCERALFNQLWFQPIYFIIKRKAFHQTHSLELMMSYCFTNFLQPTRSELIFLPASTTSLATITAMRCGTIYTLVTI